MLCNICKKNEATVHLTQIVENKMQKVDLCDSCSKAKGVDDPTGYSLASILLGIGGEEEQESATAESLAGSGTSTKEHACPNCGFTQSDFKKTGRLGCSQCYEVFADTIEGLLKSMHKGIQHVGKVPQHLQETKAINERIKQMEASLQQAVKEENFEDAAKLRDQIKQAREQLDQLAGS